MGDMLTTSEAAAILDVNPSYVRRMLKNERLKGVKHGRDWLIEREDLGKIEKLKAGRPAKTTAEGAKQ